MDISRQLFFQQADLRTRGHMQKLYQERTTQSVFIKHVHTSKQGLRACIYFAWYSPVLDLYRLQHSMDLLFVQLLPPWLTTSTSWKSGLSSCMQLAAIPLHPNPSHLPKCHVDAKLKHLAQSSQFQSQMNLLQRPPSRTNNIPCEPGSVH